MGIKKITIIFSVAVFIFLGALYFPQENTPENKVRKLPEVQKLLSTGKWNIRTEDRGDGYQHVQVYEVVDEHTNTFNWYKVNNQGDIVCSMFTYEDGKLQDIPAVDCN